MKLFLSTAIHKSLISLLISYNIKKNINKQHKIKKNIIFY